jgi:hypothetical protein
VVLPRRPVARFAPLARLALLGALALPVLYEADAHSAAPTAARPLGRLEQESVDEALATVVGRIDPSPQGKIIGQIHVVNQEVFSRRDWWFQWFNIFHRTTRADILRRELLMKPGQPYDQALVEESTRNLQSPPSVEILGRPYPGPELSSVVVILPLVSLRPGEVDLLVVTRDVWSLRFNTAFDFQQNTLAALSTSLSENNLFGWRKYLAVRFVMDLGAIGFGPTYLDPNIAGTRLTLYASATLWYARNSERYEGNSEIFSLRYPLYSLASRWGGGVDVTHGDTVVRRFQGNELRLEDLTATPGVVEELPYIFRRDNVAVDTSVVRSFGATVIQRVTGGHRFDRRRYQVLPEFPADAATAQLFLSEYAPVSEQRSEPYLRYEIFTPRYVVLRDLDTFDLRENRRLGPSAGITVSYGLPALGADFRATGLGAAVRWAVSPAGGYGFLSASASARVRDGRLIDQSATGQFYAASPQLGRAVRLILMGQAGATRADTQKTFFFLGGQTGLRGYAIDDFRGTSFVVGHVELRSAPLAVFSQRFGGLLFYDVGHAAASFEDIVPHHDAGFGLRWLIPQLNSSVIRIDWAFASHNTRFTRAGLPGRITAGFEQVF